MEFNERQGNEIRVVYKTPQFEAFYNSLPSKVQTKFKYVIDVVTTIYDISTKFVKHLLFAIDNHNVIEATRIILLNGFLKKSNKDYRKQIEIAQSILNDLEL